MERAQKSCVYHNGKEYAVPFLKKIGGDQYKLHWTDYSKSEATALVNSLRDSFKRNSYRIIKWRKNADVYLIYEYIPPLTREERKEKKEIEANVDNFMKEHFFICGIK